jgi:hypothetical protein
MSCCSSALIAGLAIAETPEARSKLRHWISAFEHMLRKWKYWFNNLAFVAAPAHDRQQA